MRALRETAARASRQRTPRPVVFTKLPASSPPQTSPRSPPAPGQATYRIGMPAMRDAHHQEPSRPLVLQDLPECRLQQTPQRDLPQPPEARMRAMRDAHHQRPFRPLVLQDLPERRLRRTPPRLPPPPKPRQPIQIRPPDGVTCGLCGVPLNLAGQGRPPLWCSPNCRQAAHRERRRAGQEGRQAGSDHKPVISTTAVNWRPRRRDERRAAVTGAKTRCANLACARAFEPSAVGRPARYCSPACRQAAHRERVRIAEAERQQMAPRPLTQPGAERGGQAASSIRAGRNHAVYA